MPEKPMNRYVVTYKIGGAVNQQKSVNAHTEAGAKKALIAKVPRATVTDVRLVMRG